MGKETCISNANRLGNGCLGFAAPEAGLRPVPDNVAASLIDDPDGAIRSNGPGPVQHHRPLISSGHAHHVPATGALHARLLRHVNSS